MCVRRGLADVPWRGVAQAVLQLTGHSDDDCRNWGRIRVLASYKLVKQLTELKPAKVPPKVRDLCCCVHVQGCEG